MGHLVLLAVVCLHWAEVRSLRDWGRGRGWRRGWDVTTEGGAAERAESHEPTITSEDPLLENSCSGAAFLYPFQAAAHFWHWEKSHGTLPTKSIKMTLSSTFSDNIFSQFIHAHWNLFLCTQSRYPGKNWGTKHSFKSTVSPNWIICRAHLKLFHCKLVCCCPPLFYRTVFLCPRFKNPKKTKYYSVF